MEITKDFMEYVVRAELTDAIISVIIFAVGWYLIWRGSKCTGDAREGFHICGVIVALTGLIMFVIEGREAIMALINTKYWILENVDKWKQK